MHECARYLGKTKGLDQPFTKPIHCFKSDFPLILNSESDFMVSTTKINLPEDRSSGQLILKSWNGELIFDGD